MKRETDQQLSRVAAAGAGDAFDLVVVAGGGLVGAFAAQFVAACSKRVIVIDQDQISVTTTVIPPYHLSDVGQAKARVLAESLARRFQHLDRGQCAGLVMDVRQLGEGFWRAAAHAGNALVIAALDHPSSTAYVCRCAREAGLPTVVGQIGAGAVEIMAFPADRSVGGYCCLGQGSENGRRPCLGPADTEPTIAAPDTGAMCAAISAELGRQLVRGEIGSALDVRVRLEGGAALHAMVAHIPKAARCAEHEPPEEDCVISSALSSRNTFAQLARELGDHQAVWFAKTLPPVTPESPEGKVPLRQLGVEAWPILRCQVRGRNVGVELTGDRKRLGLARVLERCDDR